MRLLFLPLLSFMEYSTQADRLRFFFWRALSSLQLLLVFVLDVLLTCSLLTVTGDVSLYSTILAD